jgi:hypothetical protein
MFRIARFVVLVRIQSSYRAVLLPTALRYATVTIHGVSVCGSGLDKDRLLTRSGEAFPHLPTITILTTERPCLGYQLSSLEPLLKPSLVFSSRLRECKKHLSSS